MNTRNRRFKLFEDAEHYGAKIIENENWICAVCRTYDQTHVFGRGKPKTLPGVNDIDPAANLRDDEGITDEKRKLRDSNAAYVKDGLGFDDQPFEGGWCVCGGNPSFGNSTLAWGPGLKPCDSYAHGRVYCNAKAANETCPYLFFLEKKTGKLYISNLQYSKYGMMRLQGGWVVSDFNCELNGNSEGGIRRKLKSDWGFLDIYQKAAEESVRGLEGECGIDVAKAAAEPEYVRHETTVSKPAVTIRHLLSELGKYRDELKNNGGSIAVVVEYRGRTYPVTCIKEGVRSFMLLDVKGEGTVTAKDLLAYIGRRGRDNDAFIRMPFYVSGNNKYVKPSGKAAVVDGQLEISV